MYRGFKSKTFSSFQNILIDAHNDSYLQFRWARDPTMKVTQLQQFTVTDNIKKGTRIQNYISG